MVFWEQHITEMRKLYYHDELTELKDDGELGAHVFLEMLSLDLGHLATGEVKHFFTVKKILSQYSSHLRRRYAETDAIEICVQSQ